MTLSSLRLCKAHLPTP